MTCEIRHGVTRYMIPRSVLQASELFLSERGLARYEAVVVWIGRLVDDAIAVVDAPYAPEQIPLQTEDGVGVHIPGEAITRLIMSLEGEERVLARLHSHPAEAYHSETDDLNRLISHDGAMSVVVPDFAQNGILLTQCSINELAVPGGWRELAVDEVERRFELT